MPSNGMPLNQLGTLYGSENYGCDAAYYYLYCLCCSDPFLSASENLRLLFAKNRKNFSLNLIRNNLFVGFLILKRQTLRRNKIQKVHRPWQAKRLSSSRVAYERDKKISRSLSLHNRFDLHSIVSN
jgi:hypothetical protein